MGRVYREPVDVQAGEDGRPARFAWRERLYTVSAVQEHWLVNREWWRETAPVPVRAELQFWRVEARVEAQVEAQVEAPAEAHPEASGGPGPDRPTGTYELRRDAAAGTWTLRRVAD